MNSQIDWFGWNDGELNKLLDQYSKNGRIYGEEGLTRDEIMSDLSRIHDEIMKNK